MDIAVETEGLYTLTMRDDLMEETSLSVADVAFRAGFGSIRNFNRLCKKYFNCTPIDLRKKESNVEFLSKKDSIQF